ncbi:Methyltransferase protein, partial [Caligus rogercresseyi]
SVTITDVNRGGILDLIQRNFSNNKSLIACPQRLKITELDFFNFSSYECSDPADVILVADVVYDPQITKAFFETLRHLLRHSPNATILIALERRNRTNENSEVVAPNYDSS